MRHRFLLSLLLLASSGGAAQAPPPAQPQNTTPAPLRIDTAVRSISASTGGRLRFGIVLPGSRALQEFGIHPNMDNAWGASGVMGLLMASYQTNQAVRIFYRPSTDPQYIGEIVRVDALDKFAAQVNPPTPQQ
jgi:hypothetical protein